MYDIPKLNIELFDKQEILKIDGEIYPDLNSQNDMDQRLLQLKTSLENLSYESAYIGVNLGSKYLLMLAIVFCLLLLSILHFILKFNKILVKLHNLIYKTLIWSFIIRLIMEALLEVSISLIIKYQHKKEYFNHLLQTFDLMISVLLIVSILALIQWLGVMLKKI